MPVNQKATAAQQNRTDQPPQDKTMKKLILTLCLTAAAATSAAASDEGRIAALEARIADLEHRIAVLERNGNTAYRPNRSVYVCSVTPLPKNLRSRRQQRRPGTRQSPPRLQRRNLGHVLRRPRHPLQTLRLNGSALAAADCARLRFRPSEKHARRIFRRPSSTLLHPPL